MTIRLSNTKREDITYMFFTVWVLGMSVVAVSIPTLQIFRPPY